MVPTSWSEAEGDGSCQERKKEKRKGKYNSESLRIKDGTVSWSKSEGETKGGTRQSVPESTPAAPQTCVNQIPALQAKLQDKQTGPLPHKRQGRLHRLLPWALRRMSLSETPLRTVSPILIACGSAACKPGWFQS